MMKNLRGFKMAAVGLACLILFAATASGQTPAAKTATQVTQVAQAAQAAEKTEKFVIPDVVVSDQDGKKYNFYSDLVKNKKVVINFVYTSCNGICPTTGAHFSKLRTALGDKVGKDIHMITVTTDPETDTPEKLKAWGKKYNPAPGWTLITGSVENVTRILEVFTGDGVSTGYHVPAICVVDDKKNSQIWNYGLAPIGDLVKMVEGK